VINLVEPLSVKLLIASIAAALIAAPAFAEPSGTVNGTGPEQQTGMAPENASSGEAEGERRICRRVANTETRMSSRRMCLTAREWRDFNRRQDN
jgi:hypothetical protein